MIHNDVSERIEKAVSLWFSARTDFDAIQSYEQLRDEYLPQSEYRMAVAEACRKHKARLARDGCLSHDEDDSNRVWGTVAERVWQLLPDLQKEEQPLVRMAASTLITGGFQYLSVYHNGQTPFRALANIFAEIEPNGREQMIGFIVDAMEDEIENTSENDEHTDLEPWAATLYLLAVELSVTDDPRNAEWYRRDPMWILMDSTSGSDDTEFKTLPYLFGLALGLEQSLRRSGQLKRGLQRILSSGRSSRLTELPLAQLLACVCALAGCEIPLYQQIWSREFLCVLGEGARQLCNQNVCYPGLTGIAEHLLSPDGYECAQSLNNERFRYLLRLVEDPQKLLQLGIHKWLHRDAPSHAAVAQSVLISLQLLEVAESRLGGSGSIATVVGRSLFSFTAVLTPITEEQAQQHNHFKASYPAHTFSNQIVWSGLRSSLTVFWSPAWQEGSRKECLELIKTPAFYRDLLILHVLFHYLLYVDDKPLLEEFVAVRERVIIVARYAVQGLTLATRQASSGQFDSQVSQALLIGAYYGTILLLISGHGSEAISTVLHAWRIQEMPALPQNLECPQSWDEVTKDSPASATAWIGYILFRGQYEHTRDQDLRHEFVKYCLKRFEKARKPRDIPQDADTGWDSTRNEPSPLWRAAYVRALRELNGNPNGHVFRMLEAVSNRDASTKVRTEAKEALESIGKIQGNYSRKSHRRAMLNAWFELRRAHMNEVGQPINEDAAEELRWREIREF